MRNNLVPAHTHPAAHCSNSCSSAAHYRVDRRFQSLISESNVNSILHRKYLFQDAKFCF